MILGDSRHSLKYCFSVEYYPHLVLSHALLRHNIILFLFIYCDKWDQIEQNETLETIRTWRNNNLQRTNERAHECPHCKLTFPNESTREVFIFTFQYRFLVSCFENNKQLVRRIKIDAVRRRFFPPLPFLLILNKTIVIHWRGDCSLLCHNRRMQQRRLPEWGEGGRRGRGGSDVQTRSLPRKKS